MDLKNVNRSKVLCLDNLSCIWTSSKELRQGLKAVSPHIEVDTMPGSQNCCHGTVLNLFIDLDAGDESFQDKPRGMQGRRGATGHYVTLTA